MSPWLGCLFGWNVFASVIAVQLATSVSQAATLNVIDGILYGAAGVEVDGTLYDVQFVDGPCITFFSGCDEASDFVFSTQSSATAAAQALLDQVFLDGPDGLFDSRPYLTAGCAESVPNPYVCAVSTPYAVDSPGRVFITPVWNVDGASDADFIAGVWSFDATYDYSYTNDPSWIYASWSMPVPEPGAGILIGAGLAYMSCRRGSRRGDL